MRLRIRFGLLTGVSLLLAGAIAVTATLTIRDVQAAAGATAESQDLRREARGMLVLTLEATRYGHERVSAQWHSRWRLLQGGLKRARSTAPTAASVPDLGSALDELPPLFDALVATVDTTQGDGIAHERRELLADALVAKTQAVIEQLVYLGVELDRLRIESEQRLAWLAVLGPALMALPLVAMGSMMGRRVLVPVRQLRATMARVEAGDLSARIVATRNDELGDLKRAFTRMTESLQASARRLAENEQSLRLITDHLPARVSHYDLNDRCTFANRPFCESFGLADPEAAVGQPVDRLIPAPLYAALVPRIAAVKAGEPQFFVVSVPWVGGNRHHEFAMVPDVDPDGGIRGNYVMARDVTERVEAEARIEAALHQKDLLLREVHHRVKNNMQIISSLLQLQAAAIDAAPLRAMLAESQDRIRSMALIHEKLYQHDDFARIDFADYARGLLAVLSAAHAVNVRVEVQAEPVWLGIDQAVPAGLVLNELVTNSFKHAFPQGRAGRIVVQLQADPAGRVALTVADDGVGPGSAFSIEAIDSLGLRLVRILAEQLDAALSFEVADGFACRLAFERQPASTISRAEEGQHG